MFDIPDNVAPHRTALDSDTGALHGFVAQKGVCHTRFRNTCVEAPMSQMGWAPFHRQAVAMPDGSLQAVGRLTSGAHHAGPMNLAAALLGAATFLGLSSAPLLCLGLQGGLIGWERVTRGLPRRGRGGRPRRRQHRPDRARRGAHPPRARRAHAAAMGGAIDSHVYWSGAGVASQVPGFCWVVDSHMLFGVALYNDTAASELRSDT